MSEPSNVQREAVISLMAEVWDDFVSDTGCFPDDFTLLPRRRLQFVAGRWAGMVADALYGLNGPLATALAEAEARGRRQGPSGPIVLRMTSAQSSGIYMASKTSHAPRWRQLRADGVPVISTWIDEAGKGETACFADLWSRCIDEAATARAVIVYMEPGEVLKGAFVEAGAALSCGVPVYAVGCDEFSFTNHIGVTRCASLNDALALATAPAETQSFGDAEAVRQMSLAVAEIPVKAMGIVETNLGSILGNAGIAEVVERALEAFWQSNGIERHNAKFAFKAGFLAATAPAETQKPETGKTNA